jgi:energy-converting hydrogenase Eha subunit E
MTDKQIFAILALVLNTLGLSLTFYWFDYKLFIIIFISIWANNVQNSANKK